MRYYKAWLGYDKSIPIDETELPKVLAAQITGGIAILSDYSLSGKSITMIEPDMRRAFGFKDDAILTSSDRNDFYREFPEYKNSLLIEKENVEDKLAGREPRARLDRPATVENPSDTKFLLKGINKLN